MKKSRFTDSQIMAILKRAENGVPVTEIRREEGISSALFYRWRSKFGGMDLSMVKRLKELEAENARLKKMYAEERLKAEIVQDALEKSSEAISTKRDGKALCRGMEQQHPYCLSGDAYQREVLSVSAKAFG